MDHDADGRVPQGERPSWQRYAIAVALAGIAALLRYAFTPWWGPTGQPFMLFLPAVVLAAWWGRFGPAILCTILSAVAATWWFMDPVGAFEMRGRELTALVAFTAVALFVTGAIEAMHRTRQRAEREFALRLEREHDERLRAGELQTIMEAVPAVIFIAHDATCRQITGNRAASEVLHLSPAANMSKTAPDPERPVNFEVWQNGRPLAPNELPVQRAARGELVRDFEEEIRYGDGGSRVLFGNAVPLRDAEGKPRGAVAAFVDISDRKMAERALSRTARHQRALYEFVERRHRAETFAELYEAALDSIIQALGCDRASILLYDDAGLMRFVSWRGLSEEYRRAVEGHTPWRRDDPNPSVVAIEDVAKSDLKAPLPELMRREGIVALAFVPLMLRGQIIGKFMSYFGAPHAFTEEEKDLSLTIARQVALGVERLQSHAALLDSETRLQMALKAARMGAWQWDITTGKVVWSPGLEDMHGLAPGTFPGTIEAFQRDVLPEDLEYVMARVRQVLERHEDYHVTYRMRRADGVVRWVEAFGKLDVGSDRRPLRLTGVCMDITERRQADEERERLVAELQAERARLEQTLQSLAESETRYRLASRAKDDFLAMLSHELRTPLNPVLLLATEAMRDPDLPPDVRADFAVIAKNITLEARLIDDLLDLNRIARGKVALQRQPLDLRSTIKDAIGAVRTEIAEKHLELHLDLAARSHRVSADAMRLQQVFWNVLKNSVRFTPENGTITIATSLVNEDRLLEVRFKDTGVGMTSQDLAQAFEPFTQGANSGDRQTQGGLGLGLSISRTLVERHGGTIWAESAGPGQGTSVVVRLPVAPAEETPDAPKDGNDEQGLVSGGRKGGGGRILLVEDHVPTRQTLAHLLERREFTVISAGSLADARQRAREQQIDFVISDLGLPDGDGCVLMAELRQIRPNLTGIALSGYGMETDIVRSRAAGFVDHLTKPVPIDALERALANAFNGRSVAPSSDRVF